MFLPITKNECKKLGWKELDIIFVTGDAYIDSPYIGVAILGKLLVHYGYKVGIISQPDLKSSRDILRLGVPKLFWAVTAGSIDSMVANYTPLKKKRKSDDFTPGGINNKRPDRATIRYVNLIKQFDRRKQLIVIGGIEASLRRIAHYDYWSDSIKRSILLDSKADILMYGMSEKTMLQLSSMIKNNEYYKNIKGICYILNEPVKNFVSLPSFEEVVNSKDKFIEMMHIFYKNQDPLNSRGLVQKYNNRYLIHNPPQLYPSQKELDFYNELSFEYDIHPLIAKRGEVKALHTIKNSITINRGCFGECNFCAIAVHQGTTVVSRSVESILREVSVLKKTRHFKGIINDVGGATANIYGYECEKKLKKGKCKDKRCIYPKVCENMNISHKYLITLLEKIEKVEGIKKVFIRSGLRYDLIINDNKWGHSYLERLIARHISGQLKIAPEHFDDNILNLMGKPSNKVIKEFVKKFYSLSKLLKKKQFLTYYIIVAHPGCTYEKTKLLKENILKNLKAIPEQIQIYTPLPLTWSSVMYYTEKNPFTGEKIKVTKDLRSKKKQKLLFLG